jgi:hypothetical protein
MTRVLCEVERWPGSSEAVTAAIAYCLAHGAELELVGLVRESRFEAPQPAVSERIRRFADVQDALARASSLAREAGLEPAVVVRCGRPQQELADEGAKSGATQAFIAQAHTRLGALLTGRPRVEVRQLALAP